MKTKIPVEVSARHCHLSKTDLEKIFGKGHELKKMRQLTLPSEFACEETVELKYGDKKFEKVRVVGPLRACSQIELSKTDAVSLGINAPLRLSGDIRGSCGITLVGPAGEINIKEGVIIAQRHIHCSLSEAKKNKLKDGQIVSVEMSGLRSVVFNNVAVRVKEGYKLCMHLDTDEGNAAGINKLGFGEIVK